MSDPVTDPVASPVAVASPVKGSCLCGALAWQVEGPLELMSHCHCSRCRKAHGAAYGTYLAGPRTGFRWLKGEQRVARYESSPGHHRPFCARCGSVAVGDPFGERVFIPAGCLEGDPGVRPLAHIFVASKAPWHEITDRLPRFDAYPPGYPAPELPDRVLEPGRQGVTRGSCLCGGVAYEFEGKVEAIISCHCSRCRKARSAAHASNLWVEADRFRWVCGEGLLDNFKVPDAKYFSQTFCRVCGSPQPAWRGDHVSIPAGSLDDDPGAREAIHVYVGSKAPWHEITDDLPQFQEGPLAG